ncbi:MAG: hypothetical protein ACLQVL_00265 [Terriglobia bacterium]
MALPFPETDWNAYIYVADLAEEIYQLSVKPSLAYRTYNAGGHTLSAPELVALVQELLPDAQISFSPEKPNSPFIYRMDDQRLRQELGCLLRPMREAIKNHIEEVRRRESHAR